MPSRMNKTFFLTQNKIQPARGYLIFFLSMENRGCKKMFKEYYMQQINAIIMLINGSNCT